MTGSFERAQATACRSGRTEHCGNSPGVRITAVFSARTCHGSQSYDCSPEICSATGEWINTNYPGTRRTSNA